MQWLSLQNADMDTKHDRLRWARRQKFPTAQKAAEALGIAYGTYSGHEAGSRGFTSEDAERYARFYGVDLTWLLTGNGQPRRMMAPIVGKAGAGPDGSVLFAEAQENFGEITPPIGSSTNVQALEVEGHSMRGIAEDGWMIFYDDVAAPGPEAFNELCVCWLEDGRVLVKILHPGREPGLFDLESTNAPIMRDVPVRQVALITSIMPRRQAQKFVRRNPAFPFRDVPRA